MFELFDQFDQDPNSNDFSSFEDDSWSNDDLNVDGGLTQEPEITADPGPFSQTEPMDVPQTPAPNPEFNPFEVVNKNESDIGSQEETPVNVFDHYDTGADNPSAEEISPYNPDRISDADAIDVSPDSLPLSPYSQINVDASAQNDDSSSSAESLEGEPSEKSSDTEANEQESQTTAQDDSTDVNEGSIYETFPYVDSDVGYSQSSVYDDTFYFPVDTDFISDDSLFIYDDWTSMIPEEYQDYIPSSFEEWISNIWTFFFGDAPSFQPTDSLVQQDQFTITTDGVEFDSKNGLIVDGNVQQDIDFLSQQTHSSCSLMAQEQFIARYYGKPVPESMLEDLMSKYGVYDPEGGTIYEGQTMVLDTFNIPYERNSFASINDLVSELNTNHDCIIGVDARVFYSDPSIPPGSGHAVTVVGKGIDPVSNEIKGFYITDSNFPGSAHYIDISKLSNAWSNDIISVPNPV